MTVTILKETSDAEGFLNEDVLVSLRLDKVQLGTSLVGRRVLHMFSFRVFWWTTGRLVVGIFTKTKPSKNTDNRNWSLKSEYEYAGVNIPSPWLSYR